MTVRAGHKCRIQMTGTAVARTGEACSSISATWYQISTYARRIIDPDTALTVYDNGVAIADTLIRVNYVDGSFQITSGSFSGPVTIDYSYLPIFDVAEARSFEVTFSRDLKDTTTMALTTAAHARTAGLKDISGTIGSLDNLLTDIDSGGTTCVPFTDWGAGTRKVILFTLAGDTEASFKCFAKFKGIKQGMSVEELLESTLEWELDSATGTDQTEGSYAYLYPSITGFAPNP